MYTYIYIYMYTYTHTYIHICTPSIGVVVVRAEWPMLDRRLVRSCAGNSLRGYQSTVEKVLSGKAFIRGSYRPF